MLRSMAAVCILLAFEILSACGNASAQTKTATTTTMAVTSGSGPVTTVVSGAAVTLTATVKAGLSLVSPGQVNFCDASAKHCTDIHVLGTAQLTSAGTAILKFRPALGSRSYKAVFLGTNSSAGSSSSTSALSVTGKITSATAIVQSGTIGDYTLAATVAGYAKSGPGAAGKVSFIDTTNSNALLASADLGDPVLAPSLVNVSNPQVGNQPGGLVVGDFNGDGIPDLAVGINQTKQPVSIFLGDGFGNFNAVTKSPITSTGTPVMVQDFNGDGIQDILLSNQFSNSLTVLLGNGDGTFKAAPGSPIATVYASSPLVSGDFNGDGIPDLAAAGGYSLVILLGHGDGTFTVVTDRNVNCDSMVVGDFNADGIADIATLDTAAESVSMFLGNGDGTFKQGPSSPIAATNAGSLSTLAMGDFNGDGKLDVAVPIYGSSGSVAILLGVGDGSFHAAPGSPVAVEAWASDVAVGDFNGDGIADLMLRAQTNGATLNILIGKGDGTFSQMATGSAELPCCSNAALGDFNGDGVTDIAASSFYDSSATIFLSQSVQSKATVTGIAPTGPGTHLVVASFPGDSNFRSSTSSPAALVVPLSPPVISPGSGNYQSVQTITITDATPGTTISFQAIGTTPESGTYTGPLTLSTEGRAWIQAYATKDGYRGSSAATANYVIELPPAATPLVSVAAGYYSNAQTVTLSDSTPGASIYYTLNGSQPTTKSTLYSGPITVSSSETLVASAIAYGYSMSVPATAQYIIGASSIPMIYTLAGNGREGYDGDGAPAPLAELNSPVASVVDAAGNLYIADEYNYVVRKVAAGTGIITTIAGNGTSGVTGDKSLATSAEIGPASGLAMDKAGNLFISDWFDNVIRKVAAGTRIITTYAGKKGAAPGGDNGPAISAGLESPGALACDGAGNLYVIDSFRIRKIAAATGIITAYAGNGGWGYQGDGGPAIDAEFQYPQGIAIDSSDNLYIADSRNNVIREVLAGGAMITTVAGTAPVSGYPIAGYSGDGGPATLATLNSPQGVAVDGAGNLFIADYYNNVIRKVDAGSQVISTFAGNNTSTGPLISGDGGPASSATLFEPQGITADSAGDLFIAEPNVNKVLVATASNPPPTTPTASPAFSVSAGTYPGPQTVTITDSNPGSAIYMTVDGSSPSAASLEYGGPINVSGALTIKAIAIARGYLQSAPVKATYTITSPPTAVISTVAGSGLFGFSGADGLATGADFGFPEFLALDASGNVYIADAYDAVMWKITAKTGVISIVAGTGTRADWSNIGDGGPATSAWLGTPLGVAVDSKGNLYFSDNTWNVVRKVDATTQIISTYAGTGETGYGLKGGDGGKATMAQLDFPAGLAFDKSDNLYIADYNNAEIRKVAAGTGIITTIAGNGTPNYSGDGGPATKAGLETPYALAFDGNGNLYFSDGAGSIIRMVSASSGVINTIAGKGGGGNSGDGGPASKAEIYVNALAVDSGGNIFIANPPASIREITAKTGIINTIAGNGYCGFLGDGGSATIAELCDPRGIAFDAAGDLDIVDGENLRARQVSFAFPRPNRY